MQTASDIMATTILTCTDQETLLDGHNLMQENNIRHVPVICADDGHYMGMLTHKEVLKQVIKIADVHGTNQLNRYEARIKIKDIMCDDVNSIAPDMPIDKAGEYFLGEKQGCLPVCEDDKVIGIITSVDFVKLSLQLLNEI
ncbi:MAG: CBS domain-containing protein [Pseudomonadales bacterium]|nr:CBS domain-containing protein [Pseudomonadales bacterium]